jgi:hypothetical protein
MILTSYVRARIRTPSFLGGSKKNPERHASQSRKAHIMSLASCWACMSVALIETDRAVRLAIEFQCWPVSVEFCVMLAINTDGLVGGAATTSISGYGSFLTLGALRQYWISSNQSGWAFEQEATASSRTQ